VLALQLAQKAKHGADLVGAVLVDTDQAHERIEHDQARTDGGDRVMETLLVFGQVEPEARCIVAGRRLPGSRIWRGFDSLLFSGRIMGAVFTMPATFARSARKTVAKRAFFKRLRHPVRRPGIRSRICGGAELCGWCCWRWETARRSRSRGLSWVTASPRTLATRSLEGARWTGVTSRAINVSFSASGPCIRAGAAGSSRSAMLRDQCTLPTNHANAGTSTSSGSAPP